MLKIKKMSVWAALLAFSVTAFSQASGVVQEIKENMIKVDGGVFTMGSSGSENNESPVHEVSVRTFSILKTEVTQAQYKAVVGKNYSHFKGNKRPVEEVSWYDAIVFCNKLSLASGYNPAYSLNGETDPEKWGTVPRIDASSDSKAIWNSIKCDFNANGYRLPTEAEWEYAAKGGKEADDAIYSGSSTVTNVAWNADAIDGETHTVGLKAPNCLGIYDMSGNVWEWCWDWYGNYNVNDSDNPLGASDGVTGRKIRRGGSIASDAVFCRNTNRASTAPEVRGVDLGFRIVRSLDVLKGSRFSSSSSDDGIIYEDDDDEFVETGR